MTNVIFVERAAKAFSVLCGTSCPKYDASSSMYRQLIMERIRFFIVILRDEAQEILIKQSKNRNVMHSQINYLTYKSIFLLLLNFINVVIIIYCIFV